MANTMNVNTVTIALGAADFAGDDVSMPIIKAPLDGEGGGITILRAYAVNDAATNAGTSFALALHNYGTGGTAVEGTIAGALGGTASPWAAGTPKEFTISTAFVDAGEWVVLVKTEDNSSDPTRGVVVVEYLMGR